MSLLSQLVPRHGDAMLTVRLAGCGMPETPTVGLPDLSRTARPSGRCSNDALALTEALIAGGRDDAALARLAAAVDEHVDLWTPALHTTSRFELVSTMANIDDAVTDVTVNVTDAVDSGSTAFLVWLATGRFSKPAFFDDDHLIEPNGAVIRVAGTTSVSFTSDHRADRIRLYYDRLSIMAQMLTADARSQRR
jgi:hypothetical protein